MHLSQKISQLGTLEKIVATGGVLIGAAAIVGAGAFATFTSTGLASVTADAGQLNLQMDETYTIEDMAPGDIVYKPLTITIPTSANGANLVSGLDFFVVGTADVLGDDPQVDSLTDSESLMDGPQGLHYTIKTCAQAWTATPGEATPYTCGALTPPTVTAVDGELKNIQTSTHKLSFIPDDFDVTPVSGMFDTSASDVVLYSMIVFTLPEAAGNEYQNASIHLDFTVSATQRTATTS
jgi:hypothetical protein